jgi:hypothetical protein
MSVPEATHRRTDRRGALRLSASVAALWLGLGAEPAAAALIGNFTWSSDTVAYSNFAKTCPNVQGGGSSCTGPSPSSRDRTTVTRSQGQGGAAFGDGTLFSWGTKNDKWNSGLTWINNGAAFTLDRIVLSSALPVGEALADNTGFVPGAGQGARPAWEWVDLPWPGTQIGEAMVEISTSHFTGVPLNLLAGSGGWFLAPDYFMENTPVGFLADYALTISAGEAIDIRLFESIWQGGEGAGEGEGRPDLLFASIAVQIFGTPIGSVPLPGTLTLVGLGLAALRLRSGQPLRATRGL